MLVRLSEAASSTPDAAPVTAPPSAGERGAAPGGPSFASVLRRFVRDADHGQATVGALLRSAAGGDLSDGQLIALQAGAYRYSEVIDVASRLVDRATGAIKTVLQGGGQ
jgi:hypothetical protein